MDVTLAAGEASLGVVAGFMAGGRIHRPGALLYHRSWRYPLRPVHGGLHLLRFWAIYRRQLGLRSSASLLRRPGGSQAQRLPLPLSSQRSPLLTVLLPFRPSCYPRGVL